ncbi:beta-glucosidase [Actinobaculum suis]|nr:beta-glucosidase [Actinobaculum suis]
MYMVHPQPRLGSRTGRFIEEDGLRFRDLDGDGKLSPYEDWRLPAAERAADLASRLTMEEKAGLMIIGSHYPGYSTFRPDPEPGKILADTDVYRENHPITGIPYPEPVLVASSTEKAINERHQHFFIVRDNPPARDLAIWTNAVQEVAENSRLGIPVVFASNPRNHVALVAQFGVNESAGIFAEFSNELGLAALRDPELVEKFGREAAREWRAAGIHKLYGYMADTPSEPRWSRFNGTFGEDVAIVTAYTRAVVRGMQGEQLSEESVATTIKHFPGGGVRDEGHDPHFEWGQVNEYPTENSLATYHLPPFQAAIDAGVSSIMPYYAKPVNTSAAQLPRESWMSETEQFDEVAFAYSEQILQKLLREKMGLRGYINSDSGVIDAMPWGVEELSEPERFARAVRAGVDLFSDMSDPAQLITACREGLLEEKYLTRAVTRTLREIFELGLFENPYVDEDRAAAVVGNSEFWQLGEKQQRDSVTLLRTGPILPLNVATPAKVYVYATGRTKIDAVQTKLEAAVRKVWVGAELVDSPEAADIALVWARPEISLFEDDKPGVSLSVELAPNGVDVEEVRRIENTVPTILAVNFTNPWVIGEVEKDAAAVVGTFEIQPEQLLRSLAGEDGGPKGVLPFSVPASSAAVDSSPRDVPGKYLSDSYAYVDSAGNRYTCGYGQRF